MDKLAKSPLVLTTRQQIYMTSTSMFFAILPTRVFIAISGDVIQVAVIMVPFVIAFMTVMVTIDITFGLPIPPEAVEKIEKRRENFSGQLVDMLRVSVALIMTSLVAKSLTVWFIDCGWVASIINHLSALIVGGMLAGLLIRIGDIRDIFGYLSVGAGIAQRVRSQ
nr:hypothetical protein [uncultured Rhodopila sp.]